MRLQDIPNTFQGITLAKVWAACPSACGKAAAMIFVAANGWHVGHASVKSVAVSPAGSLITSMAGGSSVPEPGAGIVRAEGSEEDPGVQVAGISGLPTSLHSSWLEAPPLLVPEPNVLHATSLSTARDPLKA